MTRNRVRILSSSVAPVALLISAGAAHAQFAGAAGQMGAVFNPGACPIGIPAVTITASNSGIWATGDHPNPSIYNPYNQPSTLWGTTPDAGKYPDFNWIADGAAIAIGQNTVWNFANTTTDYYLYPAIDHGPVPTEGLEITLWGSNNGGSTWILGRVVELYELGWDANPATISDNGATRWSFNPPVNMITAVPEFTQGAFNNPPVSSGGDYELDAVMQTPAPSGAALLGLGGLLVARRRR